MFLPITKRMFIVNTISDKIFEKKLEDGQLKDTWVCRLFFFGGGLLEKTVLYLNTTNDKENKEVKCFCSYKISLRPTSSIPWLWYIVLVINLSELNSLFKQTNKWYKIIIFYLETEFRKNLFIQNICSCEVNPGSVF